MTRRRTRQALPIDNRARHHTSEGLALGYMADTRAIARVTDRLVTEGFPAIDAARAAQTAWDAIPPYPPN